MIDTNSFVVGQFFDKCEVVEDEVPHGAIIHISKKNLTEGQRRAVYEYLLTRSVDGRLRYGVVKAASKVFGVSTRTIIRVWTRGRESLGNGNVFADVSSRMFGKKGRARVDIDIGKYRMFDRGLRKNIRSAACAINVSKSTLHRRITEGIIKRHTNALKPFLTDENKVSRLAYAFNQIDASTLKDGDPWFYSQWNRVHIVEIWFNLTEECGTFYLATDEEPPHRTGKSKLFVLKSNVSCCSSATTL